MAEMNEKNKILDETGLKEIVKIKKSLSRPKSRSQKRYRKIASARYEKKYTNRLKKDTRSLKKMALYGLMAVAFVLLLYVNIQVKSGLSTQLLKLVPLSYGLTVIMIGLSLVVLFEEKKGKQEETDIITDYFLFSKQQAVEGQSIHHNRVNTSYLMLTFLKLYKKEELAISDGRFIYGVMKGPFTKDESALLNFMMDHDIRTVDDFLSKLKEKNMDTPTKDLFYQVYKEAVVEMVEDHGYINHQITKSKGILYFTSFAYLIVSALMFTKGIGDIGSIATLLGQGLALLIVSKNMYAYSSTGHKRVRYLRRRKQHLLLQKDHIENTLLYGYLFNKEDKVIRRIQKAYKMRRLSEKSYKKLSESYNGFDMIVTALHG